MPKYSRLHISDAYHPACCCTRWSRSSSMGELWCLHEITVKPKNRPAPAGTRKYCPRYHCSWLWSNFSLQYRYNDHIWQIQPVATLKRALKGQTLATFNLGWRLPCRMFRIQYTHKNHEWIEIHMTRIRLPTLRYHSNCCNFSLESF